MKIEINNVSEFMNEQVNTIQTRQNINLAELTKGDENPFFLTLEIANLNSISKNKLLYDQTLLNSITEQINNQPVEGIMGHLKQEDRSSSFPISDIHWLGAIQQDNKVFAKGYIPKTNPATREHFRILQATGGRAATSIYGWADQQIVDAKQGTWKALTFQLEQLDLAPYNRAALAPTTNHMITAEMDTKETINKENNKMSELISEVELNELKSRIKKYEVAEYQQRVGQLVKETFNWDTSTDKGKQALNTLRTFIAEYAVAVSDNEAQISKVIEQVAVDLEPLTQLLVSALSGPASFIGEKKLGTKVEFLDTPEARKLARSKFGLVE